MPPPIKPPQKPGAAFQAEAAAAAAAKPGGQSDALATECSALEEELEELKVKYEMYFLGVEKREPSKWREDLKRKVLRIKEAFTRNAGMRFRLQSLHARFLSYERMWLRSAREKEDGTYHRDVFKAKMHVEMRARKEREEREKKAAEEIAALAAATPPPRTAPAVAKVPAAAPLAGAPRAAPPAPGARPAGTPIPARPAATPPPAGGGMGDRQMRELYTQYIAAKKQCGEDVSRLTYDAVAKSVSKQVPEIINRFKAKSVEFKVVVKDGKATLKAVPKT